MDNQYTPGRRARRKRPDNVVLGILLLIIGGALLLRQLNIALPDWLFTWPMIPIVVGLLIGFHSGFRDFGWLIICLVGVFFLADDIWPQISFGAFILPTAIIVIGLLVLFRGRIFPNWRRSQGFVAEPGAAREAVPGAEPGTAGTNEAFDQEAGTGGDNVLDTVSIFGAVKKHVFSKRFRGGEIVAIFGGAEVNLMQADFSGTIVLEVVQIFGGTTLYIPSTWQVRSETVAIFGGIEDKRKDVMPGVPERILVLDGFTMFGGIEIKSR